jgi:hypothetical protein
MEYVEGLATVLEPAKVEPEEVLPSGRNEHARNLGMLERRFDCFCVSRADDYWYTPSMRLAQTLDVLHAVEDEGFAEIDGRVAFGHDLRHAPAGGAKPALAH